MVNTKGQILLMTQALSCLTQVMQAKRSLCPLICNAYFCIYCKRVFKSKVFPSACSMSMFHSQTLVSAFFDNKRGEVFKLWVVTRKLSSDKQEL